MDKWPATRNGEVAWAWHNPDALTISPEWCEKGDLLRRGSVERRPPGHVLAQGVDGLRSVSCTTNAASLDAYSCVERFRDGKFLKHALVPLPSDANPSNLVGTFQKIALAVEPEVPAFQVGYRYEGQVYWHLLWPGNWDWAESLTGFDIALPLWQNPLFLVKEDDKRHVVSDERFSSRLASIGLEAWKNTVIKNLAHTQLALAYLDLQRTNDLIMHQMAFLLPAIVGEDFGNLVWLLMESRLGSCSFCGHEGPPRLETSKGGDAHLFECADPCRQFVAGAIWPLTRSWYYGGYQYECQRCRRVNTDHLYMRVKEPAPEPPTQGFWFQPLLDAAETIGQARTGETGRHLMAKGKERDAMSSQATSSGKSWWPWRKGR